MHVDIALRFVGQIARQAYDLGFIGVTAARDGNGAAGSFRKPTRRGKHVEQAAVSEYRINPRLPDFAQQRDALRGVFVHKNRHVRILDESAVVQSLLDEFLRLFQAEITDVHVVDQR
jgi:hypothetical protein